MLIPLALLHASLVQSPAQATQIDTAALLRRAIVLASDSLAGRGMGSAGQRSAAEFIAAELRRIGAVPGAGASYEQPVDLRRVRLDRQQTKLTIGSGTSRSDFTIDDFTLRGGRQSSYR